MYIGRYYHTLEKTNRVSLPAAFRATFGERGILTRGLDGALNLFDSATWNKKMSEYETLAQHKKNNRDFVRLMTNDAVEVEIDSHGRLLIPDYLKQSSSLEKSVVMVGSLDHIEVWDQTTYHTYIDTLAKRAEDVSEAISFDETK